VIDEVGVGQRETDPSRAVLSVSAPRRDRLEAILKSLQGLGARRIHEEDARLAPAPASIAIRLRLSQTPVPPQSLSRKLPRRSEDR